MMENETHIIKEFNLVVDFVRGEVTVESLSRKFSALFRNPEYDHSMRGLCDLRHAYPRMKREDFERWTRELGNQTGFGRNRWAIVTDDPLLTAFAELFARRVGSDHQIRVFSTVEAAEDFVEIPLAEALGA